jgi:hypothetical protein
MLLSVQYYLFFSVTNAIMWSGELQDRDSVMAQFGRLVSNEHGDLDSLVGLEFG